MNNIFSWIFFVFVFIFVFDFDFGPLEETSRRSVLIVSLDIFHFCDFFPFILRTTRFVSFKNWNWLTLNKIERTDNNKSVKIRKIYEFFACKTGNAQQKKTILILEHFIYDKNKNKERKTRNKNKIEILSYRKSVQWSRVIAFRNV